VEAAALLLKFDLDQQKAAREGGEGLGGGTTATKWGAAYADRAGLREAVLTLAAPSTRVMLGFCGDDASQAVEALKAWITALALPRGMLHGMDKEGVPIDMSIFGAVYIKYSSTGAEVFGPGDANLNGYDGAFRGVYFNPQLPDGEFRQYAVLPLDLFALQTAESSLEGSQPVPSASQLDVAANESLKRELELFLASMQGTLSPLGASLQVVSLDASSSSVRFRLTGPESLRFGIEDALFARGVFQKVEFE